jgi:hypothetical protein
MPEAPQFENRMSDAEALMWRIDRDPVLSGTFANLALLDRAPDIDRLRRRLERASLLVPRLRQRVQPSPGNLTPPQWVEDPNFDLDYHVRRIALPKPATAAVLHDLVALLVHDPLERTRPLWQFVVIEGLRGGRAAILQRMHHSVADGETGVRLTLEFIDLERDAPEPAPLPHHEPESPPPETSAAESLSDLVSGGLRIPFGILRQFRELITDPSGSAGTAEVLKGLVSQLTDLGKAQSPLWTQRSLRRSFEPLSTPLGALQEAARRFGGTLNTALLTGVADAAGSYHREFGAPVDSLRASMAVSTRTERSGTNAFTLARLTVPTGELTPRERFAAIHEQASAARHTSVAAPLERLAGIANALPTAVLTRVAHLQSQTVDIATSSLRGSPVPIFIAGSAVLANHPIGPLVGVAMNVTAMSYVDSLDIGLHIDRAAIEHPEVLRVHLSQAFKRLARAR